MEVGTEISQKIRSAIKAKLLELGSYADDELPDYIMVMVANKKSRAQMNGDLGLFLGASTDAFTEWLHGLLEKLQTITINPDTSSVKQGKTDKPKSSKEKKKEKSHKADASAKKKHVRDSEDGSEKRKTSDVVSDQLITQGKLVDDGDSQDKHVESKKPTDSLGSDIGIQKQVIERDKHIIEDYEDVREMLVTEAAEDELAVELETAEVEVTKSRTVKDVAKPVLSSSGIINTIMASHSQVRIDQPSSKRSHSPENDSAQESLAVAPRKRKVPTSVVASVRQKVLEEEEYDPHNPAFGTVASVVKVTARKSSVPPMMQANRLLLLKAMTEAERSVAARKKVAVAKPLSRDNSPAEVYSPKRKRSDLPRNLESPPLYIPSRKDSVNRRKDGVSGSQHAEPRVLTQNDARHMLNRDSSRELTSRSRRENILRSVDIDRGSSNKTELSRSPERSRKQKEGDKNEREVRSDRELKGDRNFQITCHVSSDSGLAVSQVDNRKRQHSPSPGINKNLHVTISTVSAKNVKNAAARLGKIVVERKDLQEDSREAVSTRPAHSLPSTGQRDAREDIIAKVGKSKPKESISQKSSSSRVVSNLGKEAFQKQCEAAVISVQAAEKNSRTKRNMSPDSRVVECDTQSKEEEKVEDKIEKNKGRSKEVKSSSLKSSLSTNILDVKDKSPGDSAGDDDDLSKMIDEDLGPELLDDTNGDDFTLDLDIDEDLSNVVGVCEDETTKTEIQEQGKDEKRSGTRFIVTLDGVDDRHFHAENNSSIFDQFKHPPVGPAPTHIAPAAVFSSERLHQHQPFAFPMENRMATEHLQQNHHLYLNLLGAQDRSISQASLQQLQTSVATVPSKLTPPKIQPFSISLKDSDDEHDDKEGKPSATRQDYYQQPEGDAVALKRTKISERCKFWPACAAGASCEFHHPTAHCKTFPNCKFGDKCLFIHPNCRFDSKCARPDCPYTHTSRRPALAGTTHVITLPPSHFVFSSVPPKPKFVGYPSTQTVCHYFPNCQNMNCRFLHPKPCKFGTLCKSPACPFYHPLMPGKDKLKWQAAGGQLKSEVTTIPSSAKVEPAVEKLSPTVPSSSAAVSSTSQ